MRKICLLVFAVIATVSFSRAQSFEKGTNVLKVGIGINSFPYESGAPIGLSYDLGISDAISLGLGYDFLNLNDIGVKEKLYSFRALYHTSFNVKNMDFYGGGLLTYAKFNASGDFLNLHASGTVLGGIVGTSVYLGNSFGLFAELGDTGITNAKLGLTLKF